MKENFVKVCAESATRVRKTKPKNGRPARDLETLPFREKAQRPDRGWIRVGFAAIYRWLERRIGRKWDEVFSELCQMTTGHDNNSVQLRQWTLMKVETNTFVDADGQIRCNNRFGANMGFRKGDYYVDPRDGTLRRYEAPRRVKAEKPLTTIEVNEYLVLQKLEGLWYEVTLADIPKDAFVAQWRNQHGFFDPYWLGVRDVVTGERKWVFTPGMKVAIKKRQLSRKELKHHGLLAEGKPSVTKETRKIPKRQPAAVH
jgi:hypothetical protein